ncbi:SDR family NAD(P)-dependent oxidoreductase [Streptomyces griseoloalbus]|uniref:SDR family NAD(P)-dependent oxidoreductase n=1 Tax=Streptomyces griseoloalbus TaxID=67303 RepID=A0ABV3E5N2_9ACTN
MPGSTVVLTGATSGIGEATARRLAPTTGRLILHGPESRAEVAPLLKEIATAGNTELHYLRADFDDLDDVVTLAARVRQLTASVDVLVNNAGRPGADRRTLGPSPVPFIGTQHPGEFRPSWGTAGRAHSNS